MGYLQEFLVLLGLGAVLGIVLAVLNNRLLLPRRGEESLKSISFIIFILLGAALAGTWGIERTYKGMFDEVGAELLPTVDAHLALLGIDPARVPVGEAGRVLQAMDAALQAEIARRDAGWFLGFLDNWDFSERLEDVRAFARLLHRVDVISTQQVFAIARDASFLYFFPLVGSMYWVIPLLMPFFSGLLWVSAGRSQEAHQQE